MNFVKTIIKVNIEITKEEVENITKEYLKNGGDLFTVTGIDTI